MHRSSWFLSLGQSWPMGPQRTPMKAVISAAMQVSAPRWHQYLGMGNIQFSRCHCTFNLLASHRTHNIHNLQ